VSINYRVGAEGFLYLGDGSLTRASSTRSPRSNGCRRTSGPWAGTPARQSAGAMSVATLLSMLRAKGLFHRAIVQSGTAHNVTAPSTADRIGRRLAEKMGVEATREAIATTSPRDCLRPRAPRSLVLKERSCR
jgi:para-nitrobenzyl esterase